MMTKLRVPLIFLIIGVSIGWIGSVARYGLNLQPFLPPLGPPPGGPPPLTANVLRSVNVSEDQIKNILMIQDTGREKIKAAAQRMQEAKNEFEKTVDSTKDLELLRAGFQSMLAAKKNLDETHFEIGMKVHASLTLEQSQALRKQAMKQGPPPGYPRPPEGP